MSSGAEVASVVQILEKAVCIPVIIITIVGYDYILTFSDEIKNVWQKPWTWVSTLFVIIRYIGLLETCILAVVGGILLPGPVAACTALIVIGDWGYMVFLAAADLVMILRVYALWGHNKVVLAILMFIWVAQVVISGLWEILYFGPGRTLSATVSQVLDYKFCTYASTAVGAPADRWRTLPRFCLGAALLVLAVIPTLRYSLEMYKVTKTWQSNRPIKLLVREGAVYFVVNLLYNIVNSITTTNFDFLIFFDAFSYAVSCAIMPRFIISIRELYDQDNQNRQLGLDTGFGLNSKSVAFQAASISADTGVDSAGDMEVEGDGESREIPLHAIGDYNMKSKEKEMEV